MSREPSLPDGMSFNKDGHLCGPDGKPLEMKMTLGTRLLTRLWIWLGICMCEPRDGCLPPMRLIDGWRRRCSACSGRRHL